MTSADEVQGYYEKSVENAKSGHPSLDLERLARFIAAQPDVEGPVELGAFDVPKASGASNAILLFGAEYGEGGRRVSRDLVARYLPGRLIIKQKSFADEFLTLKGAFANGQPVPEPLWLDADGSQTGFPSFVMTRIHGTPPAAAMYSKGPLADASPQDRKRMMLEAAGYHGQLRKAAIGPDAVPHLAKRGSGSTDIERELTWWRDEARLNAEVDDPKLDQIDVAYRWMVEHQPKVRPGTLVQGDSQIGNVIYSDGKLAGILDWELAYLGHNEADVALIAHLTEAMKVLDKHVDGTPTENEYVSRFEGEAGAPVEHYEFFKLFPLFKTQCVLLSGRTFQHDFEKVWDYHLGTLSDELVQAKKVYGV